MGLEIAKVGQKLLVDPSAFWSTDYIETSATPWYSIIIDSGKKQLKHKGFDGLLLANKKIQESNGLDGILWHHRPRYGHSPNVGNYLRVPLGSKLHIDGQEFKVIPNELKNLEMGKIAIGYSYVKTPPKNRYPEDEITDPAWLEGLDGDVNSIYQFRYAQDIFVSQLPPTLASRLGEAVNATVGFFSALWSKSEPKLTLEQITEGNCPLCKESFCECPGKEVYCAAHPDVKVHYDCAQEYGRAECVVIGCKQAYPGIEGRIKEYSKKPKV